MMSISSALRFCSLNTQRTLLNSCKPNSSIYNQSAGVKTTVEEKIGLPPKPKKPLTPYFRYMKQIRPLITAENPKSNVTDVVKIISKNWKTVDDSTKLKLHEEFKKEQAAYVERRATYDSKLTDEQRTEIRHLKQTILEHKERNMMKRRIRDLGKPKRPASAFLQFIIDERKNTPQTSNQTYRDWHTNTTLRWTQLPDDKKAIYLQKSRNELDIYRKELTKWEQKMVQMGHIDVVRHESLVEPKEPKPRQKPKKTTSE